MSKKPWSDWELRSWRTLWGRTAVGITCSLAFCVVLRLLSPAPNEAAGSVYGLLAATVCLSAAAWAHFDRQIRKRAASVSPETGDQQ